MKKLAPHLQLAATRIANVWVLEDPSGRKFLVDTGHPIERPSLLADLWMAGIRAPGDLTAVLLTHRHSDHAGNAAWLRKRFGARVICHEFDAAALSGKVTAPALLRKDPVERGEFGRQRLHERLLCAYQDQAPAICEVDELYDEGAWKWGFRVVPVPGHTEGSVMLYHEPTRTLFSGDAILSGYPILRNVKLPFGLGSPDWKGLRLADPGFSDDAASCHLAVQRYLRHLPPVDVLCSGHGPAVDQGAQAQLLRLLKHT